LPEADSKGTYNLVPIAKLGRSHLPLSYLDFGLPKNSLPSGSPFHANIPIFTDYPPAQDSRLLLARIAPDGGLYVVERVGSSVFVACRLRSWVKEDAFGGVNGTVDSSLLDKLCGHQIQSITSIHPPTVGGVAVGGEVIIPSPKRPKIGKGVLARMSILPKTELREAPLMQQNHTPEEKEDVAVCVCLTTGKAPEDLSHAVCRAKDAVKPDVLASRNQQTATCGAERPEPEPGSSPPADDILDSIQDVLLKTLYTTRTALAYFAKSTLARARASFRSSPTASISELADFYRSRLLSPKRMDLKYRDTIPKIVKNTLFQESQNGQASDTRSAGLQRKRSRRKKIGKDGLYPGEKAFVRTWCLNRDAAENGTVASHSLGLEIQDPLCELRNRETQLQIILILEILTLESSIQAGREEGLLANRLKQEPVYDESRSILTKTPLEINKKRDLKADLDVFVDRLCIYQSVSMRDAATIDRTGNENGESGKGVKDKLLDYCCNVILPFYFHKASDLVKEISRKLGGPDVSPKKPTSASRTASFSRANTGAPANAHRRSIPRRTLERVLSEEQNSRQFSPPRLKRSLTAPLDDDCRRDSAEPSQWLCRRGSFQKSHSFTNREVDLVANTKAQDAKLKKLANLAKQKEELNAAICALKRPNRSLAGMQIMAEFEKRSAKQDEAKHSVPDKSALDPRPGVQITATPKKGTMLGNATSTRRKLNGNVTQPPKDPPRTALTEPTIPSSTVRGVDHRPSRSGDEFPDASTAGRAVYSGVHQTPSRGLCKTSNPLTLSTDIYTLQQPDLPARTCVAPHLSLIQATPSTVRMRLDPANLAQIESTPLRMTKSQRPVMFTPLKKAEVRVENIFRDAPVVSEKAGKAMERVMKPGADRDASIYDSLGWDDELDELL
jgi:DNA replication regulator SLD3